MLLADEGRPSFSAHAAMRVGLTRSARSSCRPPPLHRRGTRCPVGGTIGTVKHRDSSCQWTVTPRPAPCQRVPTQRGQRRGLGHRAASRRADPRRGGLPRERAPRCSDGGDAGAPHAADRGPVSERTSARAADRASTTARPVGPRLRSRRAIGGGNATDHGTIHGRRGARRQRRPGATAAPPSQRRTGASDRQPRLRSLILQQLTLLLTAQQRSSTARVSRPRRATRRRSTAAPCPTHRWTRPPRLRRSWSPRPVTCPAPSPIRSRPPSARPPPSPTPCSASPTSRSSSPSATCSTWPAASRTSPRPTS